MPNGNAIQFNTQEFTRFFSKIHISKEHFYKGTPCWDWMASLTPQRYAQISYHGNPTVAHRISYQAFVGAITDGAVIDHLCRRRHCVNPCHLEPVTHKVNINRGDAPTAIIARTNICKNGHPYTPESTMTRKNGVRTCRICFNEWHKNYMLNRKDKKREADQRYREGNASQISARRKAARLANLEERRARDREWSRLHKERKKAKLAEAEGFPDAHAIKAGLSTPPAE